MESTELRDIWKSYDQKIDRILAINKDIARNLSRQKLDKQISKLYRPKWTAIALGVPYTLLLLAITFIASLAGAHFVAVGFGAISLIMVSTLISYVYQLYLIGQVKNSEDILSAQQQLSRLRLASMRCLYLAVFQLPFWSVCWMSTEALIDSPLVYGGINLILFMLLSYLAYRLYKEMSHYNKKSKIRDFFLSGSEWEPIMRSSELLEQIKEYEK